MGLMQRAQRKTNDAKAGSTFKRPTIPVSQEMRDTVDRIVAAGMKIMYAPDMAEERKAAVSDERPVATVLAENVVGLTLVLDQKSQGGIPMEAIFPAAMELLSDAAEMLVEAGRNITQDDYNDAARMMYVLIGKKLGVSDDDLMNGAKQAMTGGGDAQAQEPPPGEPPPQGAMPPQGVPPGMPPQPQGAMP